MSPSSVESAKTFVILNEVKKRDRRDKIRKECSKMFAQKFVNCNEQNYKKCRNGQRDACMKKI